MQVVLQLLISRCQQQATKAKLAMTVHCIRALVVQKVRVLQACPCKVAKTVAWGSALLIVQLMQMTDCRRLHTMLRLQPYPLCKHLLTITATMP